MKLQDLVTHYLALRLLRPASERTYRYYIKRVNDHTGITEVEECDLQTALNFRSKLLETSKGITWNSARRHLTALWRFAVEKGFVNANPWKELGASQVCVKPKSIADHDFAAALTFLELSPHHFTPTHFWRTLFLTVARTGMRRSQLIGLRWMDIDSLTQTITLRASTSKTHREYSVPMSAALTSDLELLRDQAKRHWGRSVGFESSQVFNVSLHTSALIHISSLTHDRVSHFFLRLAKLSNTSLSCHRLRHRIATRLLENDATHVRNVQALLGHSNVTTTLGYVSPNLKAIREAIEAVE